MEPTREAEWWPEVEEGQGLEASRRCRLCREVGSGGGERAESGEAGSGFGKGL